ncbi:MAG: hypothetical protein NTNFB02_36900 [Nitrospira sp.]
MNHSRAAQHHVERLVIGGCRVEHNEDRSRSRTKHWGEDTQPGADMPMIGQLIPGGSVACYHQDRIEQISLQSYRGRWVVLVFYPGDFSFICPTEI